MISSSHKGIEVSKEIYILVILASANVEKVLSLQKKL